ncbi:MAG: 50S ribosomal protein L6 [Chitinophagales bacterium]|mgnify:CR=1 FL=1|nr:50S ribosomal protein L6 [Chitinophagales bacterium]MCB9022070.1 50S ribosomal protein L6 [Chitinophagales bacterium]MCB9031799.1 50S ribosomal protein L6 [Chitinophagales bacterium]HPE96647.1 50S ribosomal protein L6 [Chitinophagales bacterium]HPR29807.1 50S ribosomal protein L6 [Chitinophagales bacterium]
MSRIGKAPIALPEGVTVNVSDKNLVTVKGKQGELTQQVDRDIIVKVDGNQLVVERPTDQKRHRAMHGLYRALIANMVKGVSEGFKKQLELVGVGYRASHQGQILELSVGYSHPIMVVLPKEIKLNTISEKGKNPTVVLESSDRQLLGQVSAKIRSLRKPEPYKGKGIRYSDEVLRRKAGKTAGK